MTAMLKGLSERYEGVTVLSTDPWILTFDNFLTDQQMKAMISTVKKWERSTDAGEFNEIGEQGRILSQGRTSSNAWCMEECENVSICCESLFISLK